MPEFALLSGKHATLEDLIVGILLRNGDIVTAERRWRGDIRCRGGRIVELAEALDAGSEDEVLDASGQLVFPGGVDPHVHMQLPVAGTVSSDDFESGTAAALAGGTTTIVDFVHPERGESFLAALAARREEASKAVADYGLHMAVTWWGEETARWMADCVHQEGIPSFKLYMAYKETVGLEDAQLIHALEAAHNLDARVLVHAEHGDMVEHLRSRLAAAGSLGPEAHPRSRPPELEGEATSRMTILAGLAGASVYIVHVTCRQAAEALAKAQDSGWEIYGETCPQYLLLDESVYEKPDFEAASYVIAPPIRPAEHQEALWEALRTGVLQVVATDHCPFNLEGQKELGRNDFRRIPGGAAGVEHRLALLYSYGVKQGRIELQQFVDLVSTRPAQLFGLYPRKGSISVGADADLVLWDPEATGSISASTHHHHCDRSIFEGFSVTGSPSIVIAAGRVQYRDGDLRVERGAGRYLARSLSA
ncbi:MAG: dihydropyrimidinase [Thermoanaerobaculia bacterium]